MSAEHLDWETYTHVDEVTCPYCGEAHGDSWEWASDHDDAMLCDYCGQTFSYYKHLEVTYVSRRKDAPNAEAST